MTECKEITIISKTHGIKKVLVDAEDYDYLNQWKWGVHFNGNTFYVFKDKKKNKVRKSYKIHRVIMNVDDSNVLVDHIDGNGLNNQKSNLRLCNKSQNGHNRIVNWGKTSKHIGVYYDKRCRLWVAKIKKNYETVYSKYFKTEAEAAENRRLKAIEINGEFATKY